jgi:hypothetical protein
MNAIFKSIFFFQLPHITGWFIYTKLTPFKKRKLPLYDKQRFKEKQHTPPSNVVYINNKVTKILHKGKISKMAETSVGIFYAPTRNRSPMVPEVPHCLPIALFYLEPPSLRRLNQLVEGSCC